MLSQETLDKIAAMKELMETGVSTSAGTQHDSLVGLMNAVLEMDTAFNQHFLSNINSIDSINTSILRLNQTIADLENRIPPKPPKSKFLHD